MPFFLRALPDLRGKGRLTLRLDRLLTDYSQPDSYEVIGFLNGASRFNFDLRPWGQKFAYYYQSWELEYVAILKRLYSGGWFIDIGSSLGLYVVCLGPEVERLGGQIVSIEPVQFNLEKQRKNVALNHLDHLVSYVPYAMGSERGTVQIAADPVMADNNAFIVKEGGFQVEVVRLDDLAAEKEFPRIGLMKMDVEGYEPMVIQGAKATIKRDKPIILAEFLRERMEINGFFMSGSWQFLVAELGYVCYALSGRKRKLRQLNNPGSAENLLFVPSDIFIPADLLA